MMDTGTSEQALRREAIRRRLQGERRCDICHDLNRSLAWFSKWWAEYRHHPRTDFADRSHTPHTIARRTPSFVEQAVLRVRRILEAGRTTETRYGLIGNRAIQGELHRLGVNPLPSVSTIQRILARHHLTQPRGVAANTAYYPEPMAWAANAIFATDIITKHLHGGQVVQNFHTFDHYTHAVHLSQASDKSSATARAHLLDTWADLGIPVIQQFDNEGSFGGGHSHPRVIGQVVRLCLFVGVEVLFIPEYEAKRNYWVEGFHSLWVEAFWSRKKFGSLNHVHREVPIFVRWYHERYRPPSLEGKTPVQMRRGFPAIKLTPSLRRLIPESLPITNGQVHFIRQVDTMGKVRILNETWLVGRRWIGQYVWAIVDTAQETLTFWHRSDAQASWTPIKTRHYRLNETVHSLLPEFRRNRPRSSEHWPG
jgi:transposase-like protein